jgi:hypothetical protein
MTADQEKAIGVLQQSHERALAQVETAMTAEANNDALHASLVQRSHRLEQVFEQAEDTIWKTLSADPDAALKTGPWRGNRDELAVVERMRARSECLRPWLKLQRLRAESDALLTEAGMERRIADIEEQEASAALSTLADVAGVGPGTAVIFENAAFQVRRARAGELHLVGTRLMRTAAEMEAQLRTENEQ